MLQTLNSISKNLSVVLQNVSPSQKKEFSQFIANLVATSGDLKELVARLNTGAKYVELNGGKQSWDSLLQLLAKANKIGINDLRRLMLEDGVRVRLLKNEVPKIDEQESK